MHKFFKTYALFISMMFGIVAHNLFTDVSFITSHFMDEPLKDITFITKYMLFVMLLITYCKISPKQMKAKVRPIPSIGLPIPFRICSSIERGFSFITAWVGGSEASANAAKVSIIRLTQSI